MNRMRGYERSLEVEDLLRKYLQTRISSETGS